MKFEICKVLALGALPLGPHGGHLYHMNTFESPAPEDDSCQVWLKSNHAFLQAVDEQLLFIGPLPNLLPTWGHWGNPDKCHQQPLFFT